jgi:hypothetical protein
VRIVVPFAPGGVADILARLMGQSLSERLGQQFIVGKATSRDLTEPITFGNCPSSSSDPLRSLPLEPQVLSRYVLSAVIGEGSERMC